MGYVDSCEWLSACHSPWFHLGAPACPFIPKVLQARERAPTPCSFIVFTSNSHLSLSRSLGARHLWQIGSPICAPTLFLSLAYMENMTLYLSIMAIKKRCSYFLGLYCLICCVPSILMGRCMDRWYHYSKMWSSST